MDEYFLTVVHGEEAVALFGAKPFDYADYHFPPRTSTRSITFVPRARR
jgi:hypothetical protein